MGRGVDELINLLKIHQLRHSRGVLVILASGSIILRSLPDFTSVISNLELLAPIVLSIFINSFYGTTVGELFTWLLYIYILYVFTPRFFAPSVRYVVSKPGFRILFTITTVLIAKFFSLSPSSVIGLSSLLEGNFLNSLPEEIILDVYMFLAVGIIIYLLSPQVFLYYFVYLSNEISFQDIIFRTDWNTVPVSQELTENLKSQNADLGSNTNKEIWRYGSLSYLLSSISPAMVIAVLSKLYPLPEIIILLSFSPNIFRFFANERQKEAIDRFISRSERKVIDIEECYFIIIGVVNTSVGGVVLLLGLSGMAFASLMLTEGSQRVSSMIANPALLEISQLSVAVALLIVGIYGVWYWFCSLLRLPSFVEGRTPSELNRNEKVLSNEVGFKPPTRPVNAMFPPVFLALVVSVWWSSLNVFSGPVYALLWVLTMGIIIWTVYKTRRSEPQPPKTDFWFLPLAWAIHCLGAIVVFKTFIVNAAPIISLLPFIPLGISYYFACHLSLYSKNQNGIRSYIDIISLVIISGYCFGIFVALEWWIQISGLSHLAYAVIGLALLATADLRRNLGGGNDQDNI